jgi:hypothetical protein
MVPSSVFVPIAVALRFFVPIGVVSSRNTCCILFACGHIDASSAIPVFTLSRMSEERIPQRTNLLEALFGRRLDMTEPAQDQCGKCESEIDPNRRIDYTLKDGTRVCDSCFVRGTNTALVQAFD